MENTIRPGDVVITAHTTQIHRGDVIVEHQAIYLPGLTSGGIIGLPGDHVACCDDRGRITVNRKPLNSPYLYAGDAPSEVRVQGHCAQGASVASRGSPPSLI